MSRTAFLVTRGRVGLLPRCLAICFALSLAAALISSQQDANATGPPSAGLGPSARVTSSVSGSATAALTDGRPTAAHDGVGASWSASSGAGTWVQFSWSRPKPVNAVQIYGAKTPGARITRGLLTFGNGATLEVGEILSDTAFPTTLAFPTTNVSSVRFTVTAVAGTGRIRLAEMRVYPAGITPLRYGSPSTSTVARDPVNLRCVPKSPRGPAAGAIYALCPLSYSRVQGTRRVQIYASGLTTVGVAVWSPEPGTKSLAEKVVRVTSGRASVLLNLNSLPTGPLTVRLRGLTGPSLGNSTPTHFQLYNVGAAAPPVSHRSGTGPGGRKLVYAEEFNKPISLSKDGRNPRADYPAAKPEFWGVSQFGEAIFPDPANRFDNLRIVDGRYLRMGVRPNPAGYQDPNSWGRTHIGAMIATARPGGSGFSAKYAHFEARILAPAATGTWPAIWLLPSDNLIAATPRVAEIDAVELYGHNPRGACHTTHSYLDGHNVDGIALCGDRYSAEQQAMRWHVYAVTVERTEIVYRIDGRIVARAPQVSGGAKPMFLLLDLALGGGYPLKLDPIQNRAAMYVDWFRVYA
jgi:Glycosyl hydrolases family 16